MKDITMTSTVAELKQLIGKRVYFYRELGVVDISTGEIVSVQVERSGVLVSTTVYGQEHGVWSMSEGRVFYSEADAKMAEVKKLEAKINCLKADA